MKTNQFCYTVTMLSSLFSLAITTPVMADSIDNFLNKMIAKGLLTEEEGAALVKDHADEKAVTEDKKKTEITASFKDGIGFASADGNHAFSVNGRIQADYRSYANNDAQNVDTIELRRAFLTAKGKMYKYYDFNVTADFAQGANGASTGTNQLDVAYFGINWWDQAKFRFGQFDMPFGLEHVTADIFLDLQERGFADALAPGKERGAMVHGKPITGVYYGLAASTGRGKNVNNTDNQVDGIDVIGRVSTNFAEIIGNPNAVYHLGVDYSQGDVSPNQASSSSALANNTFKAASGTTEARGIKFFDPSAFTAVAGDSLTRKRYGLESAIAYGPVKFQAEYFSHNYQGKNALNTAYDKDLSAWYAGVSWMLTGEKFASAYKDGAWGRLKPNKNFDLGSGSGFGAVELSVRYSDFSAKDFAYNAAPSQVGTGIVLSGAPTGAHAWTVGVQWLINPNTHLIANYVDTRFTDGAVAYKNNQGAPAGTTDQEKAVTLRAQFDF